MDIGQNTCLGIVEAAAAGNSHSVTSDAAGTRADTERGVQDLQSVGVDVLQEPVIPGVERGVGDEICLNKIAAAVGSNHDAEATAAARPGAETQGQRSAQHLHRVVVQDLDKGVVAAGEKRGGQDTGLDEIAAAVGGHHDAEAAVAARSRPKAAAAARPGTESQAQILIQYLRGP